MIPCMWFTHSLKMIFIQDLEGRSTAQFPSQIKPWFPTRPTPFLHFAMAKCIITAKVRAPFFFPSSPFPQMLIKMIQACSLRALCYTLHFWKCLFCFLFSSVITLLIKIWYKFVNKQIAPSLPPQKKHQRTEENQHRKATRELSRSYWWKIVAVQHLKMSLRIVLLTRRWN